MAAAECDQGPGVAAATVRTVLRLAVCLASVDVALAQETAPADAGAGIVGAALGDLAREGLADPTLHARAGEGARSGRFARILEGLGLAVTAFEAGGGDELALGLAFDLVKSRAPVLPDAPAVELAARGTLAFDPEDNPHDYSSALVRLRWSGARSLDDSVASREEVARKLPDPDAETLTRLDAARFAALSARHAGETSLEHVQADPELAPLATAHLRGVTRELPPELLWDAGFHAGMETDQELSSRQLVLGGTVGARLVSWDPDASASRWNLFDVPAAAVRWLAGTDERFRPSGTAWPAVALGLDVVDAAREEARGAVTDDETFLRARLEARMTSPLAEVAGETLALSAGWLWFGELNAPSAVKRAGTDDSSFVHVRLELPRGWSLGYGAGTLPTDGIYDSTFALAYELRL